MVQKQFIYDYARPAVTVDLAAISIIDNTAKVLLIRRGKKPFAGRWALPGGFVEPEEPLEAAARRELLEETQVKAAAVWPVNAFGDPDRDPRGWTISAVYYSLLPADSIRASAADDARAVGFHPLGRPPPLAFDHAKVLRQTIARLRRDLYVLPVAGTLLPRTFSTAQLYNIYSTLDPSTPRTSILRRRLLDAGLIEQSKSNPTSFRFSKRA